jgi:hypothetical protein
VIADGLVGCFRQPRNIEILLACCMWQAILT